MTTKPTLIIYGATSFTAKQLLVYLDTHHDGDQFEFILAGRNQSRLAAANAKLRTSREIIACQLDDEEGVTNLVAKGDVVVNLAGPFRWHNAEALIRECVRTGKHYVDLTGESSWLATDIIPVYNDLAIGSGSCIVPSCGFDSVPSDLTLWQALKTLQSTYPTLTFAQSKSLFSLKGASMSGGTVQSMYSVAELPKDQRRSGEYDLIPKVEGKSKPKSTIPKISYELKIPNEPLKFGSFFFMYPYNRTIIRRSQYLSTLSSSRSIASSTSTSTSTSSENEPIHHDENGSGAGSMQYEESMNFRKGKIGSSLITLTLFFAFGLFYSSKIIRKLFSYILPAAGTGASEEDLFKASYIVENVSTSTPLPNGKVVKVLTTFKAKGDPGYLSTCYLLAESALSLVLPPPEGTSFPPLYKKGGLLTPSTAMGGVLVERLIKSGKVEIESRIIYSEEDKKDL
ncbi:uncharacterized protein IL334_007018 [Kwoniella shivajii]|uniref:Saccharopine dehydrogenase NADP binding domain-containing protein n=1 Tax=Kwoniella shivajii TaxID=564305 RepID=A0ABZ1D9M0_9TREE|nr:hypothetical protein IL334_007018 [Kwoniella shivajii]